MLLWRQLTSADFRLIAAAVASCHCTRRGCTSGCIHPDSCGSHCHVSRVQSHDQPPWRLVSDIHAKHFAKDFFESPPKVPRESRINERVNRRVAVPVKCKQYRSFVYILLYPAYPSQKMMLNAKAGMQSSQKAVTRYIVKNGNQQQMKQPTMIPRVLAALVSILNRRTWSGRVDFWSWKSTKQVLKPGEILEKKLFI